MTETNIFHQTSVSARTLRKGFKVEFQVEPSDRSVGIMTESFSGWLAEASEWCELEDIFHKTFNWFDNDGKKIRRPWYAELVEKALLVFANSFYEMELS